MKAIDKTFGVSRSDLAKRVWETLPNQRGRYFKTSNAKVMPVILVVTVDRSPYGYPRIAAVANPDQAA